ncbi:MAG: hypothetical protein RPT25_00630 [Cycloclasticus sp.]
MEKYLVLFLIATQLVSGCTFAVSLSEKDYQEIWCQGQKEVALQDMTRVDCLTASHAIELDFAYKWKEAIGQSLHYALLTGKQAGIGLIIRTHEDNRYLEQLNTVIENYHLPIQVWIIQ